MKEIIVSFANKTKSVFSRRQENKVGFLIAAIFLFLFLLPSVFGEIQSLGNVKQGESIELKQIGYGYDKCNITSISIPINSTTIIADVEMTKNEDEYNYTLDGTYTQILGKYIVNGKCCSATTCDVWAYDFTITPSGIEPTTSKGILSIGILISIFFIMFFFGWIAFRFMESDKTFPIGLFFLVISIIFSVYGLYLGFIYSQDYLYSNVSEVQSRVFVGIMLGLVGIALLGMLFLTIKAVKEIRERKTMVKYGEGYDLQTKTYKY